MIETARKQSLERKDMRSEMSCDFCEFFKHAVADIDILDPADLDTHDELIYLSHFRLHHQMIP